MNSRRQVIVGLALLLSGLVGAVASAQEVTSVRFYLIPRVGTGTFPDPFRPKYLREMGVTYSSMDYTDGTFLVGATLTDAQHTTLIANADVFSVPALDVAIGGNPTLNQVKTELASRTIPNDWVVATTTWRQLLGQVGRYAQILQRMFGSLGRSLFGTGNALNTTLTTQLRDDFISVGQSFGLDTGGITTAITINAALTTLATQMPSFTLSGQTF